MTQQVFNIFYTFNNVKCRASDNSREKNSNFAGFAETNSRRKRPISWEFRVNFGSKFRWKAKKKEPRKKIYWKDVKFRARKKTQKFIQHSSEGNCTCFERQEKHKLKLYRNARPVNLLFQLQFRAEQSNAINFFSLLAVLCCFAAYKARLLVIECSNPFVKSKHPCVFDRALHERLNMCLRYYRQQFSFTLHIVSTKSLLISCAPMGSLLHCGQCPGFRNINLRTPGSWYVVYSWQWQNCKINLQVYGT